MPSIVEAIGSVADELLDGFEIRGYRRQKVIHDAVHGSHVFEPHETALLDLPLVQRLRRIRQLGLVLHVYPSGSHSRFDHSIGVFIMASRLIDALKRRDPTLFTDQEAAEVRIAALLHDIGHMPFSHITEEIMDDPLRTPELTAFKDQFPTTRKIHEMFGATFLRTAAFQKHFAAPFFATYPDAKVDFDRIADLIVGKASAERDYQARIVSGVLDADKMDYILRDCHTTGLRMSVDIDRILQTAAVVPTPSGARSLGVDLRGVSTVEQLLFDKLLLNMAVYHHQKVRATECGLKGLFEYVTEKGVKVGNRNVAGPIDLLALSDDDFLVLEHHADRELRGLARRLTRRDLLMRVATISRATTEGVEKDPGPYLRLLSLADDVVEQRRIREALAGEVETSVYEAWVDVPKPPPLREAANFWVDRRSSPPVKLDEIFSITQWLQAYDQVKYQAHVFLPRRFQTPDGFAKVRAVLKRELELDLREEARTESGY
ncbi:MAG TPA: HD domain-containing protein [Vicinamibacterales bacterium]|nr:HD domain-containing protein [Vicinamibacterales bacterium]